MCIRDRLIPLLKDCDGYVAGLDSITQKVINACDHLKVISRYGAGYDRVDIAAAKAKGIPVTNTPGVNAEAVGELTFALILAVARRIPYLDVYKRQVLSLSFVFTTRSLASFRMSFTVQLPQPCPAMANFASSFV